MIDQREADALANMMGADSRRIDALVEDVGEIRGDVRTVRDQVGAVASGVAKLTESLSVLIRHEIVMEQHANAVQSLRSDTEALDKRVQTIEQSMPGLIESRGDSRKVVWLVISAVVVAVLGLVVIRT